MSLPATAARGEWINFGLLNLTGPNWFEDKPDQRVLLPKFDFLLMQAWGYDDWHDGSGNNLFQWVKLRNPEATIIAYNKGIVCNPKHIGARPSHRFSIGRWKRSDPPPRGALDNKGPNRNEYNQDLRLLTADGKEIAKRVWGRGNNKIPRFKEPAYARFWARAISNDFARLNAAAGGVFDGIHTDGTKYFKQALTGKPADPDYSGENWRFSVHAFYTQAAAELKRYGIHFNAGPGNAHKSECIWAWPRLNGALAKQRPESFTEEHSFVISITSDYPTDGTRPAVRFYSVDQYKAKFRIYRDHTGNVEMLYSNTACLVDKGKDNFGHELTHDDLVLFALGCYAMVMRDADSTPKTYFALSSQIWELNAMWRKVRWFDIYDATNGGNLDFGRAKEPYHEKELGGGALIFWREFDNGYVYVNVSPEMAKKIRLPRDCREIAKDNYARSLDSIAVARAGRWFDIPAHRARFFRKTGAADE